MPEGASRSRNGRAEALSPELLGRLRQVGRTVSPEQLAELWIFPPLEEVEASSEFLLFTRNRRDERLGVYSALVEREGEGTRIVEHGEVPAGRMPRFVERFRRRLGEEREPIHVAIDGRPERWTELVEPATNGKGGGPRDDGGEPGMNGGPPKSGREAA